MATPLSRIPVLTIDEQIEQLKAKRQAELDKEIEQIKLSAQVDDARFELKQKIKSEYTILQKNQSTEHIILQKKHNQETKELNKNIATYKIDFEKTYGQAFELNPKKPSTVGTLSTNDKCKYVLGLKDTTGKLKYSFNGTDIVGAKGEPIKSTIVFKDVDGNKQTLSVKALTDYSVKSQSILKQFEDMIEETEKE